MSAISWARRGRLHQKYMPLSDKGSKEETVLLGATECLEERNSEQNKRFLEALKDGGVWLS